jgi:phage terminase small subunit
MAKYQTIKLSDGEEIRLTEREILFCDHYLTDCNRNATEAIIRAGYSKKSARTFAAQTLAKSNIQRYIQHKSAPLLERLGITQEIVMREYASIGLSRLSDYMNDDYTVKPLNEIHPDKIAAMSAVEVIETTIGDKKEVKVKFRLHDKVKALDRLYEVLNPVKTGDDEGKNQFFAQINNYYNNR